MYLLHIAKLNGEIRGMDLTMQLRLCQAHLGLYSLHERYVEQLDSFQASLKTDPSKWYKAISEGVATTFDHARVA